MNGIFCSITLLFGSLHWYKNIKRNPMVHEGKSSDSLMQRISKIHVSQ